MRTTLDFDDELLRAAKRKATDEGKSLTRLMEDAVRAYVAAPVRKEPYRFRPLIKKGRRAPPVDVADRDSLYDLLDRS